MLHGPYSGRQSITQRVKFLSRQMCARTCCLSFQRQPSRALPSTSIGSIMLHANASAAQCPAALTHVNWLALRCSRLASSHTGCDSSVQHSTLNTNALPLLTQHKVDRPRRQLLYSQCATCRLVFTRCLPTQSVVNMGAHVNTRYPHPPAPARLQKCAAQNALAVHAKATF